MRLAAMVSVGCASVLFVAGCSTGGEKHSTPTTAPKTARTTTTTPTAGGVAGLTGNQGLIGQEGVPFAPVRLDPCPSDFRSIVLYIVNDNGVGHQRGRLVPFDAERALVCGYRSGKLNGFVHLAGQAAEAEVDDTNLLPPPRRLTDPCPSGLDGRIYLITFWRSTYREVLKFECPYVSNSFRGGLATRTWIKNLDILIDDAQRAGRRVSPSR